MASGVDLACLESSLVEAQDRARVLQGKEGVLVACRQVVLQRAAQTELQLNAFLNAQVCLQREGQRRTLDGLRKQASQAVSDLACACFALTLIARFMLALPIGEAPPNELRLALEHEALLPRAPRALQARPTRKRSGRCGHQGSSTLAHRAPPKRLVLRLVAPLTLAQWRQQCRVEVEDHGDDSWGVEGVCVRAGPPLSEPKAAFACGALQNGGAMLVAGGRNISDQLRSFERADAESGLRWALLRHAPLPTPRQLCVGCVVGRKFVVVGGRVGKLPVDTVQAFDTEQGAWASLPPLPVPTLGCAVIACGGRVYVVGGGDGTRAFHTAWALPVLVEANNEDDNDNGNDNNPDESPQWETLARMSVPRCWVGGAAGRGRLLVCGGKSYGGVVATCEAFSTRSGQWESLPPMPTPRRSFACAYGGGNLFVAGGTDSFGNPLGSACALVLQTGLWVALPPLATPRELCGAVCAQRRLVVLGGHLGGGRYSSESDVFEFGA